MRRLLGALLALFIWSLPALAADQGFVVAVCGTPTGQTYTIPGFGPITVDQNGNLCVNTSGGGGGGGAVFGPTAAGSPAANPPVIIGGTSDGTATGNVTNWKVVSGIGYLNLAQVNAVTILTGAGATGTGSQRVTVAQDATTVAGLPPGQALAAASAPVVLTAAQLATLTPPTTVTANQGAANATPWNQNTAQINGQTVQTGTGTAGTGTQRVAVSSDSFPATQAVTQSGNWTARVVGNAGGVLDAVGQNAAAPANWLSIGCDFFTTPTTITNGNGSPCQMDNAGNLLVNLKTALPAGSNAIGSVTQSAGPANVTATDCSATVVTGGSAVNAFTAQTTLHGFTIANIDTTEVMWISFTTTAAASGTGSYPLPAATATTFSGFGSFTAPPGFGLNHALSVVAATNGHKFSCTWW
jgi:hypothetical protein